MDKNICIKAIIKGRVQGVFFRASTQNTAKGLNLTGYVRNLTDGSVEAEFRGNKDAVKKMLEWCHTGPPASRVDHVLEQSTDCLPVCDTFEIRY